MEDRLSMAVGKLEIPMALLDYHATTLTDDDLFWFPAPHVWTMHRTDAGWVPDLADVEPEPVPVPTIAWLTWHMGWWLGSATAELTGRTAPAPGDTGWPGEADRTVEWLRARIAAWEAALVAQEELDRTVSFPWPVEAGKTIADLAGWVVVELTKNVSELGLLLLLRRSGLDGHQ